MNGRLKTLRMRLGLKQGDFAKRIEIAQGSYSDIENGKKPLTDRNIKFICLTFGVHEPWLRTGTGEMFVNSSGVPDRLGYLSSHERELVELYDKLLPDIQKKIRDYIQEKYELQEWKKQRVQLQPPEQGEKKEAAPEIEDSKGLIDRFSQDLALVLQDAVGKAVDHVKNQYQGGNS